MSLMLFKSSCELSKLNQDSSTEAVCVLFPLQTSSSVESPLELTLPHLGGKRQHLSFLLPVELSADVQGVCMHII